MVDFFETYRYVREKGYREFTRTFSKRTLTDANFKQAAKAAKSKSKPKQKNTSF